MHLLWRENADILSDETLAPFSVLPTHEAIAKILEDPRHTSRYNLIWKNSNIISVDSPNWKNEEWFGNFWDAQFPWIYHEDLIGFIIAGVSTSSFWFYSDKLGWVWTGSSHYPYLYSNKESSWIIFMI